MEKLNDLDLRMIEETVSNELMNMERQQERGEKMTGKKNLTCVR